MNKLLPKIKPEISAEIFIGGSKSESNRLLILNALFEGVLDLDNLSDSEDTNVLSQALQSQENLIDIHHAGTAMRFLTAFCAIEEGKESILTGSDRMKQRPIGILVDALRSLGAEISYLEKEGFPPIKILGKSIQKDSVQLKADTSSQFITALMLIAPKLPHGLKIELVGKITSLPYLMMTVEMMRKLGIQIDQEGNSFQIHPISHLKAQKFVVESDWSSASYFYSLAAIGNPIELKIHSFFENSLQGDAALVSIYRDYFGVNSEFSGNQIRLTKNNEKVLNDFELDLNATPDIAQTIIVTAAALKLKCKLTGLETLKIKETDRILALENELKKLGVLTQTTDSSIEILSYQEIETTPIIQTYHDHRMAMSFAPYCLIRSIEIENPEVVEKSYPNFWNDFDLIA
jgi:3-phosphoshikimate 1-carboxyvinyltransferase